ncbi:hypothetical protein SAMN04244560_02352 [Thermoanaerobacter thermohydrosulfuricus]|uniref:Uncharacterized protein n=3 Tax=Thermoanaerobacter TaxID=1754 RepID=I9AGQ1_9THEO|nr:hypothetical protein TheetDRAFT_1860 [Thermoanaerobacter ethanolicus JW 200]EIW01217.1 hypothetical protein ThesiDRAFT1_2365 [Thermoanaerobacter siderophilus SR4]EMT40355.1 hypothetical protein TthWC1_0194 [Thermoanaerobacter thermohydrosulfuricus WC1]SDG43865.1 hypothetical protein SAMN04244560_02352 [Thermoanaerobacter thermohydrosulfuricus]SFE22826.1 hypothetical protein SAMN04324257_01019 [Thermoanaerobacter thermohydrosulfuricus]
MKRNIASLLLIGLAFTFLSTTFAFANEKENEGKKAGALL